MLILLLSLFPYWTYLLIVMLGAIRTRAPCPNTIWRTSEAIFDERKTDPPQMYFSKFPKVARSMDTWGDAHVVDKKDGCSMSAAEHRTHIRSLETRD